MLNVYLLFLFSFSLVYIFNPFIVVNLNIHFNVLSSIQRIIQDLRQLD